MKEEELKAQQNEQLAQNEEEKKGDVQEEEKYVEELTIAQTQTPKKVGKRNKQTKEE